MATHNPTDTAIAHTTDAEFRTWIGEFHTAMLAIGLVVASDTGQLDLATATRPAVGVAAGYRIYKTNDGLTDLYLKIEFGTQTGGATWPQIWVTAGWGTNGAGTINASGSTTRSTAAPNGGPTSTVTPRTTRACGIAGAWWIGFKLAATGNGAYCGLALHRFCNGTGAPTADGFILYSMTTGGAFQGQQSRASSWLVSTVSANFCFLPADVTSPVVGSDIQFWKHYTAQPRMRVNPFAVTCDVAVAVEGTQRTLTPVGSISHNFISNGSSMFKTAGIGAASSTHVALMVWE